jgi:hypothetical protein
VPPYENPSDSLTVAFENVPPVPSSGSPGQEMTFSIKGLSQANLSGIVFLANGIPAEVKAVTPTSITIVLPPNVSSGGVTLKFDGKIYLGPSFTIRGNLYRDETFNSGTGANGFIYQITEYINGDYIINGSFTKYQDKDIAAGVRNIARISSTGLPVSGFQLGSGMNSGIYAFKVLSNGDFLAGGGFSTWNGYDGLGSIVKLNPDASLRTKIVDLYVPPSISDPSYATDTVSEFNGVLLGGVAKLFVYNDSIYALGSFYAYGQYFYERSTKNNKLFDGVPIKQLCKMTMEGEMDSSYNFNKTTNQGLNGFNGGITDVLMQSDGKLVTVGNFSNFNGVSANNIIRLNTNGTPDNTFAVGSGSNGNIYSIRYNAAAQQYILTGDFSTFNGVPAEKMVILNMNGSVVTGFSSKGFSGGNPTFAMAVPNTNLILVTGSFTSYNGVPRGGMMVLNTDGTLAAGYNNTGSFNGFVNDAVAAKSGIGNFPALILVGYISSFENQTAGSILKLVFRP